MASWNGWATSCSAVSSKSASSRLPMSYPAEKTEPEPRITRQRASSVRECSASASRSSWSRAPRRSGFEMVSRATPAAGSSSRSFSVIAQAPGSAGCAASATAQAPGSAGCAASASAQAPGSAGCAASASLQDDERVALGHRLALLADDLLHDSLVLRLDRHLHLHRLEDYECVALLDLLADLTFDLPDGSCDVSLDVGQVCSSARFKRGSASCACAAA